MSKKFEKLKKEAMSHLEQGEEIIAAVMGAYESKILGQDTVRNGVFLATNKRVVFYGKKTFGYDLEVFPYSNISSIEMSKEFMGHKITFIASGNKVKMKWINVGEINEFVNYVKENIGKKSSESPTSAADEIRKYKELLDEGIITAEEFEQKKKQLLGLD